MQRRPRQFDPFTETPEIPVLYTDGNQLPAISGTSDTELTGYSVRLTLQRPEDVLVKTALMVVTPGTSSWSVPWLSGDIVEGARQKLLVEYVAPGGESQTILNALLSVGGRLA